jgi:hypothetical protein
VQRRRSWILAIGSNEQDIRAPRGRLDNACRERVTRHQRKKFCRDYGAGNVFTADAGWRRTAHDLRKMRISAVE